MSGVIDRNGQQWEHCNVCAEFVRIQDLLYDDGRDICESCIQLPRRDQDALARHVARKRAYESLARYEAMGWDVTLQPDLSIRINSTGDKEGTHETA